MSENRVTRPHPIQEDLAARMKRGKVVSVEEAVNVIRDGDTVAAGGFVGIGFAEEDSRSKGAFSFQFDPVVPPGNLPTVSIIKNRP